MFRRLAAIALVSVSASAWAQVGVADPWVRAAVPGQQATGAFMQLTAAQGAKLVGGSTPVAAALEVHEMKMEGDVMKMRALTTLDLPAGQAVALKPGGYHIMLIGLKGPLSAGDTVPLTLTFQGADGKTSTVEVKAPVRALNTPAPSNHGGHKH